MSDTAVPGRLNGKTAVVTGSSSGNGRAIALALAAEGANLVCSDLTPSARPDGFEPDIDIDTDELIRQRGGNAIFQRVDVTLEAEQFALCARAVDEFGRVDIWVNNAGIGIGLGELQTNSLDDLKTAVGVNVYGTWLGCKAAITQMRTQDVQGRSRGRIINIGSIAADGGQPDLGIYSITKGGVHSLTRQLAIEVAPVGINVNALAPGYIPTAMTRASWDVPENLEAMKAFHPWFELARVEDVAGPVVFLASDEAAFITGVVLPVDGGVLAR